MKKAVKAWAVVTKRGKLAFVTLYRETKKIYERAGYLALPCPITYDLPKKRAKK